MVWMGWEIKCNLTLRWKCIIATLSFLRAGNPRLLLIVSTGLVPASMHSLGILCGQLMEIVAAMEGVDECMVPFNLAIHM